MYQQCIIKLLNATVIVTPLTATMNVLGNQVGEEMLVKLSDVTNNIRRMYLSS